MTSRGTKTGAVLLLTSLLDLGFLSVQKRKKHHMPCQYLNARLAKCEIRRARHNGHLNVVCSLEKVIRGYQTPLYAHQARLAEIPQTIREIHDDKICPNALLGTLSFEFRKCVWRIAFEA